MKFAPSTLLFLVVLFASVVNCFSLDREAFSIRNYDLKLQVDPAQHRLGGRGKVTLRNDTKAPQTIAVLQVSSSLDWRSVRVGDKAVQVVRQPYASDMDHTGALSEAIVTLPQAVAPQGTVDLTIAYEGVITLDATRLTRIGTPQDAAESTDWDRIDPNFSAVRGAGYVAWYPIATEAANLSEGDSLFEVLARWRAREAGANMDMFFESTKDSPILLNGTPVGFVVVMEPDEHIVKIADSDVDDTSWDVPIFAMANFKTIDVKPFSKIAFLPGREGAAESYRSLLQDLNPLPSGRGAQGIEIVELPYANAAPFWAGEILLMPLKSSPTTADRLTLVYALARRGRRSPRLWIGEGLAHYAQVRDLEQQHGRPAALDYLKSHLQALAGFEEEQSDASRDPAEAAERSLIDMTDEVSMQSKAMWVWWMLRDMLEEVPFNFAVSRYRSFEDKNPSYMQKLLEGPTRPDLQWFFDDWVYHDRGLPDFKVASAFSTKTTTGSFIVTVTVDNLGAAGAEVPVIVKFTGGESTKRLEVRGKNKATIRVEVPAAPQEIVVNDGSVPESDVTNNVFKIEAAEKQ